MTKANHLWSVSSTNKYISKFADSCTLLFMLLLKALTIGMMTSMESVQLTLILCLIVRISFHTYESRYQRSFRKLSSVFDGWY